MKAFNQFINEKLKLNKNSKILKQFDPNHDPIEDLTYERNEPKSNKDDYIKLLFINSSEVKIGNYGFSVYVNLNNISRKNKNAIKNLCDNLRIYLDDNKTHTYILYWNDHKNIWKTFALFTRNRLESFWDIDEIENKKYKFE